MKLTIIDEELISCIIEPGDSHIQIPDGVRKIRSAALAQRTPQEEARRQAQLEKRGAAAVCVDFLCDMEHPEKPFAFHEDIDVCVRVSDCMALCDPWREGAGYIDRNVLDSPVFCFSDDQTDYQYFYGYIEPESSQQPGRKPDRYILPDIHPEPLRISLPEGLAEIGDYAFYGLNAPLIVDFPSTLTRIGHHTFQYCLLQHLRLPDALQFIGDYAFESCMELCSIYFPAQLRYIGAYAFFNCPRLQRIELPEGLGSIGEGAFSFCGNVRHLVIPSTVTEIGPASFIGLWQLRSCYNFSHVYGLIDVGNHRLGYWDFYDPCYAPYLPFPEEMSEKRRRKGIHDQLDAPLPLREGFLPGERMEVCSDQITGGLMRCYLSSSERYSLEERDRYEATYIRFCLTPRDEYNQIENWMNREDALERIQEMPPLSRDGVAELLSILDGDDELTAALLDRQRTPEEPEPEEDEAAYSWRVLDNNTAEILRYNRNQENVTVPGKIAGYTVTRIADCAFAGCTSLEEIALPKSLTHIGDSAFRSCQGISDMQLPENITHIGSHAFFGCNHLVLNIKPDSDAQRYAQANNIAYRTWDGAVCRDADYDWVVRTDNTIALIQYHGQNAAHVTVPEFLNGLPVRSIERQAFQSCNTITQITLPQRLTSISSQAFADCTALTRITLPESLKSIGNSAFYHCTALTEIALPEGLLSIGYYAFADCTALTDITLPESLTYLDKFAFPYLKNTIFHVKSGSYAHTQCIQYENVHYRVSDATVFRDGDYDWKPTADNTVQLAAYHGKDTEVLEIPAAVQGKTVTSIGISAFGGCSRLKSVTMPEGVRSIADRAFLSCSELTKIVLPKHLETIGNRAFDGCSPSSVSLPGSLTQMAETTWSEGYREAEFQVVPGSYAHRYAEEHGFSFFFYEEEIRHDEDFDWVPTQDGTAQIVAYRGMDTTDICIPHTIGGIPVTSVNIVMFASSCSAETLILPDSLTDMGDTSWLNSPWCEYTLYVKPGSYAERFAKHLQLSFRPWVSLVQSNAQYEWIETQNGGVEITEYCGWDYGCLNIPAVLGGLPVCAIGSGVFQNCTDITDIQFPESLVRIGANAFAGCTGLTDIALPEGILHVESEAFSQCTNLASLTLPETLGRFGWQNFFDCKDLTLFAVPGSLVWNTVKETYFTVELCPADRT